MQPENALYPIQVTLLGIVTFVSEVQPENTEPLSPFPIEVTLSGIVTLVSEVQSANAELPIEVTLFGIVTLVSEVQPENADSPIEDVTPLPMTTSVNLAL